MPCGAAGENGFIFDFSTGNTSPLVVNHSGFLPVSFPTAPQ